MNARELVRRLLPPILRDAASRVKNGRVPTVSSYQGVTTIHNTSKMHRERFGEIHDRRASLDPHLGQNVTRLRHYQACLFADYAKHLGGDFVSAGISYGVAPRVIYEFVEFERLGKTYHLVDAFVGANDIGGTHAGYNTDVEYVREQYAAAPCANVT